MDGALILTASTSAFHSTNLFCCFSRYHAPTNSVAPSLCIQTTYNPQSAIRSDEGRTLETSVFESLYGDQFTLSTQLIKPNYLVVLRLVHTYRIIFESATFYFRIQKFPRLHVIGFVADLLFSTLESGFKNNRIRVDGALVKRHYRVNPLLVRIRGPVSIHVYHTSE